MIAGRRPKNHQPLPAGCRAGPEGALGQGGLSTTSFSTQMPSVPFGTVLFSTAQYALSRAPHSISRLELPTMQRHSLQPPPKLSTPQSHTWHVGWQDQGDDLRPWPLPSLVPGPGPENPFLAGIEAGHLLAGGASSGIPRSTCSLPGAASRAMECISTSKRQMQPCLPGFSRHARVSISLEGSISPRKRGHRTRFSGASTTPSRHHALSSRTCATQDPPAAPLTWTCLQPALRAAGRACKAYPSTGLPLCSAGGAQDSAAPRQPTVRHVERSQVGVSGTGPAVYTKKR